MQYARQKRRDEKGERGDRMYTEIRSLRPLNSFTSRRRLVLDERDDAVNRRSQRKRDGKR